MRIYVASSWRNEQQPLVVKLLREHGHAVYDFREPVAGAPGFSWSEIDPSWESWDPRTYREKLKHPIAEAGYESDREGMNWADACVLLMPSGRSAHLEAGFMAGDGKPVIAYLPEFEKFEPELMYLLLAQIVVNDHELLNALARLSMEMHPGGWSQR